MNTGLSNLDVRAIVLSGSSLFAGTHGSGVFESSNNGTSWKRVNLGLTDTVINSFCVTATKIFAGTGSSSVFAADISSLTGVNNISEEKKLTIYPNPFYDQTTARLNLPGNAKVEMTLYNSIGQKISSIENATLAGGDHSYQIKTPSAGLYLVSLMINGNYSCYRIIRTE